MPVVLPAALAAVGGGSFLGELVGASPLISAAGGLLGGLTSAFGARGLSQADAMALQYNTARHMYRDQLLEGPAWEMEGLRRAGINPMLRYGHGGAQPPMLGFSPSVTQPFNRFEGLARALEEMGPSAFRSFSEGAAGERSRADVPRTQAETRRLQEEALRIPAEVQRIRADTRLTEAQQRTELDRQSLIVEQAVLARAQQILPAGQMAVYAAQIEQMDSQTVLNDWTAELRRVEIDRESYEASIAGNRSELSEARTEHDMRLFNDAVLGFILRTTRAFSSAAQGRE